MGTVLLSRAKLCVGHAATEDWVVQSYIHSIVHKLMENGLVVFLYVWMLSGVFGDTIKQLVTLVSLLGFGQIVCTCLWPMYENDTVFVD